MSVNVTTPSLLIVEDDQSIRNLLVAAFRRYEIRVHTAADGIEALALTAKSRYSTLLVDVSLPRMGGVEFLKQLRHDHPGYGAMIFVMTAAVEPLLDRIESNLAHAVVRKPFDIYRLTEVVYDATSTFVNSCPGDESMRDERSPRIV
jgi:DNA-binding response OmpR family regulator